MIKLADLLFENAVLDVLTNVFTTTVRPADLKHIKFWVRKGGQALAMVDSGHRLGNMDVDLTQRDLQGRGVTMDDVVKALKAGGAQQVGSSKSLYKR